MACILTINIMITVIALLTVKEQQLVNAYDQYRIIKETEAAYITFHFTRVDINSPINFELAIGDREAFCRDGNFTGTGLGDGQESRIRVRSEQSPNTNNQLVAIDITLVINDVRREDAGTYTARLLCKREGSLLTRLYIQTAGVIVKFPPGKALCSIATARERKLSEGGESDETTAEVKTIHCVATAGSEVGDDIRCYHQENRIAPLLSGSEDVNGTHIEANFVLDPDVKAISCCSSVLGTPTPPSDCNDFLYKTPKISSPIPTQDNVTAMTAVPISNSRNVSDGATASSLKDDYRNGVVIPVVLVFGLIFLAVVSIASIKKKDKLKAFCRRHSRRDSTNTQNEGSDTNDAML